MARSFTAFDDLLRELEPKLKVHLARRFPRLDPDDALQVARFAAWRTFKRRAGLEGAELFRAALTRARGAIADLSRDGFEAGRTWGKAHGWSVVAETEGARVVGLLPQRAYVERPPGERPYFEALSPYPNPEELLLAKLAQERRLRKLRRRLRALAPRNRQLVCLVLLGVKQCTVAELFGMTAPRVSQIFESFVKQQSQYALKNKRRALALEAAA
jgi:DNA-directed RNA polymerase specialized sigma24 family protein